MLKRAFLSILTLFALLVPLTAQAEWVTKEIKWQISSVGSPTSGTAIYVRDTSFNVVAAGQTDTTGKFTLNKARPWRDGHAGAATTVDTIQVAYLMLQPDSSANGTNTLSTLTVEVDGQVGGYGANTALNSWAQVDSLVAKFNPGATGAGVVSVPIRAIHGLGYPDDVAAGAYNLFYRIMSYETLRVRLTAATGLVSGAVRAFIRYWEDE